MCSIMRLFFGKPNRVIPKTRWRFRRLANLGERRAVISDWWGKLGSYLNAELRNSSRARGLRPRRGQAEQAGYS